MWLSLAFSSSSVSILVLMRPKASSQLFELKKLSESTDIKRQDVVMGKLAAWKRVLVLLAKVGIPVLLDSILVDGRDSVVTS